MIMITNFYFVVHQHQRTAHDVNVRITVPRYCYMLVCRVTVPIFRFVINNNNNALYFYTHIQSTTLFKGVYNG